MSRRRSHFIRSFGHALEGIVDAVRGERHMRFHLIAAVIVAVTAAGLRVERSDWLWLLTAIAAVWIAELFNTAIERVVDLATLDINPLAKAAKDTAAGAVLVAAFFAASVGVIVLGPRLWTVVFQ